MDYPTLVVDNLAIARRDRGAWVAPVPARGEFRPVGLGKVGRPVAGRLGYEPVPEGFWLSPRRNGVLFSGPVRAPRRVTALSLSSPVYRNVLARYLRGKGVGATPRLTQVVRTDLDGDGTDEVLLVASSRPGLAATGLGGEALRAGDYSLVLLRSVVRGRATERALWWGRGKAAYADPRLAAVADLDGDGRMEFVLSFEAWETQWGELWSFRAGRAKQLARRVAGV